MTTEIYLMHKQSKMPTKGSSQAAGWDLYSSQSLVLFPNETGTVGCGFVSNAPGILDADYRGEIKVILHNLGKSPFSVKPGDRVAQMVFHKVERTDITYVNSFTTTDTDRGTGGFGSTGVQ